MRYRKGALHISQLKATQLIVTQQGVLTTLSLLANQVFKQFRCIYLTDPEHLHGVIKGLLYSPGSKQILHTCSLLVMTDFDYF